MVQYKSPTNYSYNVTYLFYSFKIPAFHLKCQTHRDQKTVTIQNSIFIVIPECYSIYNYDKEDNKYELRKEKSSFIVSTKLY